MDLYSESQHAITLKKKNVFLFLFLTLNPMRCSSSSVGLTVNTGYIKGNQCILITKTRFPEKKINRKYRFQCHLIYMI